jgi:Protein of unknown function (DUF4239)
MDAFLYALPDWLIFLLIVGGSVGLAWAGTVLLRRRTTKPLDEKQNEVAGFIFASVGVIYAVLLAFTVIIVWEQYLAAENAVSQEAAALIIVAHDTSSFPEPARGQAHDLLRAYAQFVIAEEWRTMDEGTLEHEESTGALAAINTIWSIYRSLPPGQVDSHTTDSLDNLSAQRAIRLESSVAALPGVLWIGLVLGAAVTICFCLFLHMENVKLHAALTALLTGLIAMSLWMIVSINHPFAGSVHLSTEAFQHAIYVIDHLPR